MNAIVVNGFFATVSRPTPVLVGRGRPRATKELFSHASIDVITDSPTILRLFLDNIGVTKPNCAAEFVETLDALDAELEHFLTFWQQGASLKPELRQDRSPKEMVDGLIAFMIHGAILVKSHQLTDRAELEHRLHRHVEAFLIRQ